MIIEERSRTKEGFEYIIGIHTTMGYRVGYVGVYEQSPLYGHNYTCNEIDAEADLIHSLDYNIRVHGGLTYSGCLDQNIIGANNPYYFGFDCAHLDDGKITPEEMENIIKQHRYNLSEDQQQQLLINYSQLYISMQCFETSCAKDLDFVRNECLHLSSQLKSLELEFKKNA
jgi:hypothetical protein